MDAWFLFSCNSSIQFIFINAKASFIAVLKKGIGKTTFFLIFCLKMHELSLNIANTSYVWPPRVMNRKTNIILVLSSLIWSVLRGKKSEKIYRSIEEIPVFYPYLLGFDDLRCTQYRPLPDWLSKWTGGGVNNGKNDVTSAWCSWCWCILWCEIGGPTSEFYKSFQVWSQEALCKAYTALKTSKTDKKVTKMWKKSDIVISRKNAPVAELSKTESFSSDNFLPNDL